jgi:hypothetical protein
MQRNPQAPQAQPPQQTVSVQMIAKGKFDFMAQALVGVDYTLYRAGQQGRKVTVLLLGPHSHDYLNENADEFFFWYEQFTGKSQVLIPQLPRR